MIKGDDNYPRIIANTITFLQYHNLQGKERHVDRHGVNRLEETLAQKGEVDDEEPPKRVSKTCRQFEEGTCPFKKNHTWKEYPANTWSLNHGKSTNDAGELILCTIGEFEEALEFNDEDLVNGGIFGKDDIEEDKLSNDVKFYPYDCCNTLHHNLDLVTYGHIFMQDELEGRVATLLSQNKGKINPNWVLLDSQSTIDVFCNPKLLKNIRTVEKSIDIHCNAGITSTNVVGDLDGYGTVWYDPNGIANILSLHRVIDNYHVQFDSRDGNKFVVWRNDGSSRPFTPRT